MFTDLHNKTCILYNDKSLIVVSWRKNVWYLRNPSLLTLTQAIYLILIKPHTNVYNHTITHFEQKDNNCKTSVKYNSRLPEHITYNNKMIDSCYSAS